MGLKNSRSHQTWFWVLILQLFYLSCTCEMSNDPTDQGGIQEAYDSVRSGSSDVTWALFGYTGKLINVIKTGSQYDDFLAELKDDERWYGYVRFETGDEKVKFAFITWIGPSVTPLKKAKVSTDKAFVKNIVKVYAKEILSDEKSEVAYNRVLQILQKASGGKKRKRTAHY